VRGCNCLIEHWRKKQKDKIVLGYCGNLGEAHSVDFLMAVVENIDPERFHLVLTVYSAKSNRFLEQVGENRKGF